MNGEEKDKISNEEFFEAWKTVCTENEKHLLNISGSTSDYTNFILKKDDSIITKVAEKFGLETYTEYYHIDAVLYKQVDCFESVSEYKTWGKRKDFCLKRIRIAFEHENNLSTAYQEIIHLLTTKADKKIVVTYAEKENTEKHAKDFCKIIEKDKNDGQNIMVIFGCYIKNEDEGKDEEKGKFEWIGYELTDKEPKKIN